MTSDGFITHKVIVTTTPGVGDCTGWIVVGVMFKLGPGVGRVINAVGALVGMGVFFLLRIVANESRFI